MQYLTQSLSLLQSLTNCFSSYYIILQISVKNSNIKKHQNNTAIKIVLKQSNLQLYLHFMLKMKLNTKKC